MSKGVRFRTTIANLTERSETAPRSGEGIRLWSCHEVTEGIVQVTIIHHSSPVTHHSAALPRHHQEAFLCPKTY